LTGKIDGDIAPEPVSSKFYDMAVASSYRAGFITANGMSAGVGRMPVARDSSGGEKRRRTARAKRRRPFATEGN
jgi:hypothetical protein